MKSLSYFITEALSKGNVTPKLRAFIDKLDIQDLNIKSNMLAPANSKYTSLEDLITYFSARVTSNERNYGIDFNEDLPCMAVVEFRKNLYAVVKVRYEGIGKKIVYGDKAVSYALFDLKKPSQKGTKGREYNINVSLYNGVGASGVVDPSLFEAEATLLIHNCTNDRNDDTKDTLDELLSSDVQLFSIQWNARKEYLNSGDDEAVKNRLVYSLEDVRSVLLNSGRLNDEWDKWMGELRLNLSSLANESIGNTVKSFNTRWNDFKNNIYRYNVDKYDEIRNLIIKKLNGEKVEFLADKLDTMNSTFEYFLSELRNLIKAKTEVSANGKISRNTNYLIELRRLFEKPFVVKVDPSKDFEMETKCDTILKLAVVCCPDKELIDEYISKFGDPLK